MLAEPALRDRFAQLGATPAGGTLEEARAFLASETEKWTRVVTSANIRLDLMFDPVLLELLWTRLISIVDEAAAALLRTSFSTVVREIQRLRLRADRRARGARSCRPRTACRRFIGTLPAPSATSCASIRPQTLSPGDILITNDIWMGTGHLPDITVAKPIFAEGAAGRLRRARSRTRRTSAGASARPMRATSSRRACRSRHEGRARGRAGRRR